MSVEWRETSIAEILRLEYGKPLDETDRKSDGRYPVYGANGEKCRTDKFYFDKPSIIVGRKGSAGEINLTEAKFWPLDVTYFVTYDDREYDLRFLYYLLSTLDLPSLAKGVKPGINRHDVYSKITSIPPLPEQQRIVGVLDEAFEGMATARANAERARRQSLALATSYVNAVFTQRGHDWGERRIDDLSTNLDSRRVPITKSDRVAGDYPYYGASGIVDYVADYIFDSEALLVSEDGANLLARSTPIAFSVSGKYWVNNHAHILRFENRATQRFVEFYLESIRLDEYITGAAQPKLTQKALNSIPIHIPDDISVQAAIVKRIEALAAETERLASLYHRKLAALDELKQSLLHQAFAGQLVSSPSAVVPKQEPARAISTTDLHAGILAIAYELHEQGGRTLTFGHVKAEKIAHMIEAHLGIGLGREPMKDAAGPNDYPRLKRVEHRARKAGFFDFSPIDGSRYRVTKYARFDGLVERTRTALGDRNRDVDALLELMLPMDTQQSEIFTTVYAAWNNLLLNEQPVADEDIVREARENWHPDKLKIPRERFFKAIAWMRATGVTPSGTGRKVVNKGATA